MHDASAAEMRLTTPVGTADEDHVGSMDDLVSIPSRLPSLSSSPSPSQSLHILLRAIVLVTTRCRKHGILMQTAHTYAFDMPAAAHAFERGEHACLHGARMRMHAAIQRLSRAYKL